VDPEDDRQQCGLEASASMNARPGFAIRERFVAAGFCNESKHELEELLGDFFRLIPGL
jgi:hypothetical protein